MLERIAHTHECHSYLSLFYQSSTSLQCADDSAFCFELRYAYAVASALHGVQHILRKDFMLQACAATLLLCLLADLFLRGSHFGYMLHPTNFLV